MKEIKIKEEFRVPGTNVIVEKGDILNILKEDIKKDIEPFVSILKAGGSVKVQLSSSSKKSDLIELNKDNFKMLSSTLMSVLK